METQANGCGHGASELLEASGPLRPDSHKEQPEPVELPEPVETGEARQVPVVSVILV